MSSSIAIDTPAPSERRGLRIALWCTQVLLALAFALFGSFKLALPLEQLVTQMHWVEKFGVVTRFIGASEVAGALGLILPSATRVMPKLTPIAASLLAVVMVLGAATHVAYGEFARLPANVLLGGLAAFVAWGRLRAAPIAPRGR